MDAYKTPDLGLKPYQFGEAASQAIHLKLNTNENPYVVDYLPDMLGAALPKLNLYPDPNARQLIAALAQYHGVTEDQVFVGNGSDEVLAHAFKGLLHQEYPVYLNQITYPYYESYCKSFGFRYEFLPMAGDLGVDLAGYPEQPVNVVVANPNANTGLQADKETLLAFIGNNPQAIFIIDEAYADFGNYSLAEYIHEYPNLLVVHTYSKSRSLAGIRVGYALGQAPLIQALLAMKDSFNSYPLNSLSQAIAVESVRRDDVFQHNLQQVKQARQQLTEFLQQQGFELTASQGNFVLATHPQHNSDRLYNELKQEGILVRQMSNPLISQYLRISVPKLDDVSVVTDAMSRILAK